MLRLQGLAHSPQLSSIRVLLKLCFFRDWVEGFCRPWKFHLVVNRHNQILSAMKQLPKNSDYLAVREEAQCHFV
jgi:hypothetical protein